MEWDAPDIALDQIYNVDCMDLLAKLPDQCVDLVLTDPPYGIDFQSSMRIKRQRMAKIANDKEPFTVWLSEAYRVLKNSGGLFCFYRWDVANVFIEEARRVGFDVQSELVWDKVSPGMGNLKQSYAPQHESIMWCTKKLFEFPDGKRPATILRFPKVPSAHIIHPNEKPVGLMRKLILDTTKQGDVVLDLFMGSGVTARAAKDLDRRFLGSELDPDYCRIANDRLLQGTLF